ncbi:hypothetical protein [Leuconostoc citreum]|uniref:hypothetical protein n=1 Tax=Leuconostoc citreum TaxID=33964 RepID=UPI000BFED166|nr:hypothetical protein [Leuconostoc citreum]
MVEIARSLDTKKTVLAHEVWKNSLLDNSIYRGKRLFRCLDDHCGAQLTLANWRVEEPIRAAYFKLSSREPEKQHKFNCQMEYGTDDEKNQLLENSTGVTMMDADQQTVADQIENTIQITQAIRPNKSETDKFIINKDSSALSVTEQDKIYKNYRTSSNIKGLTKSTYQSLMPVMLWWKDHPEGILEKINWPAIDREGQERATSFITPLKFNNPFLLNNIIINLNEQKLSEHEYNKVKIFYGEFHGSSEESSNHTLFSTLKNPSVLFKIRNNDLKNVVGIKRLRQAIKQNKYIELAFCGHFFFSKKDNHLVFVPRTPAIADWLAILGK